MKSTLLGQPDLSLTPFRFSEPVLISQFSRTCFRFQFFFFRWFLPKDFYPWSHGYWYFWLFFHVIAFLCSLTESNIFGLHHVYCLMQWSSCHLLSPGLTVSLFNWLENQIWCSKRASQHPFLEWHCIWMELYLEYFSPIRIVVGLYWGWTKLHRWYYGPLIYVAHLDSQGCFYL